MCGRFTLHHNQTIKNNHRVSIECSYNIAPSSEILVLLNTPARLYWGLSVSWSGAGKLLINCRSETINEKKTFKQLTRCVIPMSGWYEWQRSASKKIPFYHFDLSNQIIYVAGLCNEKNAVVVTKEAENNVSYIHHRQPVLINENQVSDWNDGCALSDISHDYKIQTHRVTLLVNNPRNNTADNILAA